ncbi:hypothetical protein GCM10022209_23250 [Chitinophaga oryziterrae]
MAIINENFVVKKSFDILNYTTIDNILDVLSRLGVQCLTPTGHGFEFLGAIPIRQAVEQSALGYSNTHCAQY